MLAWIDQVPLSTSLIKALRQSHKASLISVLELNQNRSTSLFTIQEKLPYCHSGQWQWRPRGFCQIQTFHLSEKFQHPRTVQYMWQYIKAEKMHSLSCMLACMCPIDQTLMGCFPQERVIFHSRTSWIIDVFQLITFFSENKAKYWLSLRWWNGKRLTGGLHILFDNSVIQYKYNSERTFRGRRGSVLVIRMVFCLEPLQEISSVAVETGVKWLRWCRAHISSHKPFWGKLHMWFEKMKLVGALRRRSQLMMQSQLVTSLQEGDRWQ